MSLLESAGGIVVSAGMALETERLRLDPWNAAEIGARPFVVSRLYHPLRHGGNDRERQ